MRNLFTISLDRVEICVSWCPAML